MKITNEWLKSKNACTTIKDNNIAENELQGNKHKLK